MKDILGLLAAAICLAVFVIGLHALDIDGTALGLISTAALFGALAVAVHR